MNRRRLLTLPLLGAAAAGTGALSLPGAALAAPVKIPLVWQTQLQDNWCGPASLRIASSAWYDEDDMPGQRELANQIGTDSNGSTRYQMLYGTEYIFGRYTYELEDVEDEGGLRSSRDLREEFWRRIEKSISEWTPPIVNVVVPANSRYKPDDWTNDHTIDHWFVIYGYEPTNRIVYILDPASTWPGYDPDPTYGIRFDYLCQLVMKAYLYAF
ncbi:hypothetical protein GCM10010168_77470 [Actinoplanes ianthinogenes]|uniref:Peptidase C39-like domain-containing protein n=1 Tax=Actinoplanes ianthinogenes TaxID=122358 RepID=A0ABM7M9J0_9ACTN|nr:C39 family peptidase [Actinoplanes ianthinogenes]BCJ48327.1 hypothetical protein Aiant_89840 [Actinoplanes ianthinogenes]GGR47125.1 hypothetical protein GCM10010168_77470 [Actinoplanes ianthinogenes]